MKDNAHHSGFGIGGSIAAALALMLVAGCATGPTPEELARREQARVERQASADARRREAEERRRQHAEEQREVLARQKELKANLAGVRPSSENMARAEVFLSNLNAVAGQSLQTDDFRGTPKIRENMSPVFRLDNATGRLTLQLTRTQTRELMLRHVHTTRTIVEQHTFQIRGHPAYSPPKEYEVIVDMGDDKDQLIRANDNGAYSFKRLLVVNAKDAIGASKIKNSLNGLVKIYEE